MSTSPKDKKRIVGENRYNFDQQTFIVDETDWHSQNQTRGTLPSGHDIGEHSPGDDDQQWHQPAPMKKRKKAAKRARKGWQTSGWWPAIVIATLVGLASFFFVINMAGGGNFRNFIASFMSTPESVKPDTKIANKQLTKPEPQKIAEVAVPKSQPVEAAPPIENVEPPALISNTEVTAPLLQTSEQPEINVTTAAKIPKSIEVRKETVHEAKPVAIVPSPPPEAAPVLEKLTETEQKVAAPAPATALQQGDLIQDCAFCPVLVAVSSGNYIIQTATDPNIAPKVTHIDHDYAIGRDAITFEDWDKCVVSGACVPITNDAGWGRGSRPLIFVSYEDVTKQYLPWLTRLTGKVYRLPTKDEWQFAALGGAGAAELKSQNVDASEECFNASGPTAGNCTDSYNGTAPVGSFQPNGLGLNDMKGNVWVWSADCWQPFTYAPSAKPNDCSMRVVLGGAWSSNRNKVSAQITGWEKSSKRANSIGLRVVRTLP
jgi:formylglycine-generating enzyme required for sulfatase activity